jgi:hypothetical protein
MTGFDYQKVTVELLQHTVNAFTNFMKEVGEDYRVSVILYECYPYEKIIQVPYHATAFANRGKHYNCTVALRWAGESHDKWVKDYIKKFVREAREIERGYLLEHGLSPTVVNGYANFNLPEEKAKDAFQENLPKLMEVKKKWDPQARFNKWFNVPIATSM